MLRTAPFVAAGVLSMVLFYSETGHTFDWEQDSMLIMIFLMLCWTVFYAVSQQLPYSKKNIIDDLLVSSLFQLGPRYRINIMELRSPERIIFDAYFEITYGHGYNDPAKYKEQITFDVPGASQAYKDRTVIYLDQSQLNSEIDSDVKHLWSAAIKNRRGESVAVLNLDNIADDTLSTEIIKHNKKSIEQLADLIRFYWELPT